MDSNNKLARFNAPNSNVSHNFQDDDLWGYIANNQEINFGLNESAVIRLMRAQVKPRSFRLWRKRVSNRNTKHLMKRSPDISRGYCPTQYKNR